MVNKNDHDPKTNYRIRKFKVIKDTGHEIHKQLIKLQDVKL